MTNPSAPTPPRKIMLATDLSCRGDRALDRSVRLARDWKAELLVVHAIEKTSADLLSSQWDVPSWRRPRDPAVAVRDQLRRDMADQHEDIEIDIHVEEGEAGKVVLKTLEGRASDLIVAGVSRDGPEDFLSIGGTLRWLARKSPVPLLIVRERALAPYRKLIVATDFSPSSQRALETAVAFFPKADVSIFHGYDIPFAGYLGRDEISQQLDALGATACDKFLGEADIPADMVPRIGRLIEHGAPERLLSDYSRRFDRHLTVVGSHGGGAIYDILIGSIARKIIEAVPGDVLLVPEPKARQARP